MTPDFCKSGRWGPYRQASPSPARHRPGARSRAGNDVSAIVSQTNLEKENSTMSFHSWLQNLRSALAPGRGQRQHAASRLAASRDASAKPRSPGRPPRAGLPCAGGLRRRLVPQVRGGGRLQRGCRPGPGDGERRQHRQCAPGQRRRHVPAGSTAQNAGLGPYAQSVAVGDFNADGKLDVATAIMTTTLTALAPTTSASCSAVATARSNPPSL